MMVFLDGKSLQPVHRSRFDKKIQNRMPYMFTVAELESQRGGKIGMEVGTIRERVIVSLLRYAFGKDNVNDKVPTTEPDTDVFLYDNPISIKTKTGDLSGVKISWTVDADSAQKFIDNFQPKTDLLFVNINWNSTGGFYYVPLVVQERVFRSLKKDEYIKMPKPGTNPRGISYSKDAIESLISDDESYEIKITWTRPNVKIDILKKWDELWEKD